MEVDAELKDLGELLYGTNYQVFLQLYRVPFSPGSSAVEYITQALGPAAVVGGTSPVFGAEVLADVENALRYAGNYASGPDPSVFLSKMFDELMGRVLSHIRQAASEATLVEQFWLKDGHPAYPVFWDFGYVFAGPLGAEVLIGSSSD
jgi:hypothetical protein